MGASASVSATWALSGEPLAKVPVRPGDSVWHLRRRIAHEANVREPLQLVFQGRTLTDPEPLNGIGLQEGVENAVSVVRKAPRLVVTASQDCTAKLWDAEQASCLHTYYHDDWVRSAAFSPDGRFVLTASRDTTAVIWSADDGSCIHTLIGHETGLRSALFSPDGKRIATGSDDGVAKLWDFESGECTLTLQNHNAGIRCVTFSADGQRWATASGDKYVHVHWLPQCEGSCALRGHTSAVHSVDFSPCCGHVVTGSGDGSARIWKLPLLEDDATPVSGRVVDHALILSGHVDIVNCAKYSPDGARVATASCDHTARIWSVSSGECLQTLSGTSEVGVGLGWSGHCDWVFGVSFSADGLFLVTCGGDWYASLWLAWSCEHVARLSGHSGSVFSAAFGPG